jgi:hypothetical protein
VRGDAPKYFFGYHVCEFVGVEGNHFVFLVEITASAITSNMPTPNHAAVIAAAPA